MKRTLQCPCETLVYKCCPCIVEEVKQRGHVNDIIFLRMPKADPGIEPSCLISIMVL